MARGLRIATNYYNRLEAVRDFNALGTFAANMGYRHIVEANIPPLKSGWRTIDKANAKIRTELRALGIEAPPNLSSIIEGAPAEEDL